jgi:hypothetical protein
VDLNRLIRAPLLDDRFPLPLDSPFTLATAAAEGVTPKSLRALCRAGLLRRMLPSVYVACQAGDSISLRARALGLVVPEDAVICDRHAGWLHGAQMVLLPNEHLELRPISMFRPSDHGRLRNKLADSGERNLIDEDICELDGLRVTTPLRTAWDLGRQRHRDPALSGLDAMLRLQLFSSDELLAGVERFKGMRWVTTLRALAPLADGRAASPGESALRLRWYDAQLPAPEPQWPVESRGRTAYLDLAEPVSAFAAEYDGLEWHSSDAARENDQARRAWLDQDEGWVIRTFTCDNIYGRDADAWSTLRQGYADARARRATIIT